MSTLSDKNLPVTKVGRLNLLVTVPLQFVAHKWEAAAMVQPSPAAAAAGAVAGASSAAP